MCFDPVEIEVGSFLRQAPSLDGRRTKGAWARPLRLVGPGPRRDGKAEKAKRVFRVSAELEAPAGRNHQRVTGPDIASCEARPRVGGLIFTVTKI